MNRLSDDTFRGARNLSLGRITKGLLGQGDRADFYKFSASSRINFSLTAGGFRSNVNVKLFNNDRVLIASSQQPKNRPEQISATLDSGTFFIKVERSGRGNTRYTVNASAIPVPPPPPPPPPPPVGDDTIATAFNVGVLTTTYSKQDTIGTTDLVDFYKFTLNDIANLDVRVSSSAQVRSVQLIRDQNNNGLVDNGEVFAPRPGFSLRPLDIPPGTYFIKVEGFSNVSSPYELTLVPTLFGGNVSPPEPGNTLPLASNTLGVLSGTRVVKDYVGTLDEKDIYQFTLNDLSNFQVTFTGSSNETQVQLIRDSNNNGLIDSGEVFASEQQIGNSGGLIRDLPVGTYFLLIEPEISSNFSTSYQMNLVATPYGGNGLPDPGDTWPEARNLGVLSGTSSLKEYIGLPDLGDFYRFTLSNNAASLQATLTNSSATGSNTIRLIRDVNNNNQRDSNDEILANGFGFTRGIPLTTQNLQAGSYLIEITPGFFGGFPTNYQLDLTIG